MVRTPRRRDTGKGWHNESKRHDLARQGISTSVKNNVDSQVKLMKAKFNNEFEDVIDTETLSQFAKEEDFKDEDITDVTEKQSGVLHIEAGSNEYLLFEDDDTAEEYAKDRVREDLQESPEMFSKDWLKYYTSLSDMDRQSIASDMTESYASDIRTEDNGERLAEESGHKEEFDELNEKIDEEEDTDKLSKLEKEKEDLLDKAEEELREKQYDDAYERLKDPYEYFVEEEGIYTSEEFFEHYSYAIDIEEATDDAVATDGWQHFVSSYDGNSHDLPNGSVYVRTG